MNPKWRWPVFMLILVTNVMWRPVISRAADAGPSFDCAAAKTDVEKTICGDPALAQDDLNMADLYQKILAHLPEEGKK
jgi:uncharacterized protein